MRKYVFVLTMYLFFNQATEAGTGALRYSDVVFSRVKTDSVVYCTQDGISLYMDVYQPAGDTARQRPLIILAHGGSFIHGNRKSDCIPDLCRELASRGFVVASIDYRLTTLPGMATKRHAFNAMMKSVADGRSCVRWFINDAAQGNSFAINPAQIFFGGSSAGGILAEHLAYIHNAAQCPAPLSTAVGKYLPDTGALPPHAIRGCISLAGAVLDTNLIGAGGPPVLHIQGDADPMVPYGYQRPVHKLAPFKLAGLGASRPRYKSQHIDFSEYVFINGPHTPWDYDSKAFKIVVEQIVSFANREMK